MKNDRESAENMARSLLGPNAFKAEYASLLEHLTTAVLAGINLERTRIQAVVDEVCRGADELIERWKKETGEQKAVVTETT